MSFDILIPSIKKKIDFLNSTKIQGSIVGVSNTVKKFNSDALFLLYTYNTLWNRVFQVPGNPDIFYYDIYRYDSTTGTITNTIYDTFRGSGNFPFSTNKSLNLQFVSDDGIIIDDIYFTTSGDTGQVSPYSLAFIYGGNIYYNDAGGALYSMPVSGGSPTTIVSSGVTGKYIYYDPTSQILYTTKDIVDLSSGSVTGSTWSDNVDGGFKYSTYLVPTDNMFSTSTWVNTSGSDLTRAPCYVKYQDWILGPDRFYNMTSNLDYLGHNIFDNMDLGDSNTNMGRGVSLTVSNNEYILDLNKIQNYPTNNCVVTGFDKQNNVLYRVYSDLSIDKYDIATGTSTSLSYSFPYSFPSGQMRIHSGVYFNGILLFLYNADTTTYKSVDILSGAPSFASAGDDVYLCDSFLFSYSTTSDDITALYTASKKLDPIGGAKIDQKGFLVSRQVGQSLEVVCTHDTNTNTPAFVKFVDFENREVEFTYYTYVIGE